MRTERRFVRLLPDVISMVLKMSVRWLLVGTMLLAGAPVHAQLGLTKPQSQSSATLSPVIVTAAPDSPRASYDNFVRLGVAGEWTQASQYLALSPEQSTHSDVLARRLKLVLDQRLALESSSISPLSLGDTTDGDVDRDRIGVIPGPSGLPEPVLMMRVNDGGLARWVFSGSTVGATDYWFGQLSAPWLRDRLPPALMREGPLHVLLWQWIGLLIAVPLLYLLSFALSWIARNLLSRIVRRTATDWDDLLLERMR
ncbi:MAG: hypothetical protein ABI120_09545, partial [Gemmatimonadaceae bacterium]